MLVQMRNWARRSKNLIIAFKILQNWRMKSRFVSGNIETSHGSSHSSKSLAESVGYVDEQFRDYLQYGGLQGSELAGKRILELGFGDNVGVALRFLAAGAAKVVCIDKFYAKRDVQRESEIYASLRERLSEDEKQRFNEAIQIAEDIKFNENRLCCINGLELETAAKGLLNQAESFDFIISRAVIEEIYEPASVFAAADKLLAPGGVMLHKIDLSDYGMFAEGGMHPLTFLTIPGPVYRLMASDSGIPNRKLIGYYQKQMSELGYDAKFLVTGIIGQGPVVPHKEIAELKDEYSKLAIPLINDIRPRLSREFRKMPDEQLMVHGIFLIGRKPLVRPQASRSH